MTFRSFLNRADRQNAIVAETGESTPTGLEECKTIAATHEHVSNEHCPLESQPYIDPEVEKSLLRKLDFRMMPAFFIMYFLNHWDRNGLPQARLNGLEKDLGMHGNQYNVCISIFYVGYLLVGPPSNMILTRVSPNVYLGTCMCGWAIVSACTGAARSYIDLLMLRFLLGFLEAPFYPGALFVLSRWYKKKELATRMAVLYCGQLASTSFSSLITAGIFASMGDRYGIQGWRWLFIIEGTCTFGVALVAILLLPGKPGHTKWLSEAQNQCAIDRLNQDSVTTTQLSTPLQGFVAALKDWKVCMFMFIQNMHFCAMSFNQFFPTIVATLGYNDIISLCLTAPPFTFAALLALCVARSSDHFRDRSFHIIGCCSLATVGFILASATTTTAPRYVACFLFAGGAYAMGSVILAWAASNFTESHEKKAVTLSLINFSAAAANIYTAYLWPASDGPRYLVGLGSSAGFCVVCIASVLFARETYKRINRKLVAQGSPTGEVKMMQL